MKCLVILCANLMVASAFASDVNVATRLDIIDASPAENTLTIQNLINAGTAVVIPCNVIIAITGLTVPPTPRAVSIRGECPNAGLQVTTNNAAINCAGLGESFSVRDLIVMGTNSSHPGAGRISESLNLGQKGIHLNNCPNAQIQNIQLKNIAGNGLDIERSLFAFNSPQTALFSNIAGSNNYRLIHTHNYAEYLSFINVQAYNNVIGVEVESGNVIFSNSHFIFNSIGIKINGQANQNPCHGVFNGGSSNHNTINLMVLSCGLGETFNGVNFLGDQSGGITSNSVGIRIYNSKGVTIGNGHIGTNIELTAIDPVTGDLSLNGANMLSNNYVRDDLSNFVAPVSGIGTILLRSGNYNARGPVAWND